jgi:hypothetical protein
MTTWATRVRELSNLEGFEIKAYDGAGEQLDLAQNGLARYDYERAAAGTQTVAWWIANRFRVKYPTLNCEILLGDGQAAHGNMRLSVVRATYEESA